MADRRTYVRMHDGLPDSPKLLGIDADGTTIALCGWLYSSAIYYASRAKSDGLIPLAKVSTLTTIPEATVLALAKHLLDACLWHERGHTCTTCPQPPARHYIVHDYLDHNRSRMEIDELIAKRVAAGQRGGQAKAANYKNVANGVASASGLLVAKGYPDTDTTTDKKKTSSSSGSTRRKNTRPVAARFDEFWAAYPRRDDRAPAEKAWTEAVEDGGIEPQVLIDAAARYAKERKGQPRNFTKLAATWLHKRSWENEPMPLFDESAGRYRDEPDRDYSHDWFDEDPR